MVFWQPPRGTGPVPTSRCLPPKSRGRDKSPSHFHDFCAWPCVRWWYFHVGTRSFFSQKKTCKLQNVSYVQGNGSKRGMLTSVLLAKVWSWYRCNDPVMVENATTRMRFFTRFFTSSPTRPASLPWFVLQSPLLMWHLIMCKQMKQKHRTYNMHHMFWLLLDLFSFRFSTDWKVEFLVALQPTGRTHAAKKRLTDRPTFTAGRMPWFGCDKLRFQFASLHF